MSVFSPFPIFTSHCANLNAFSSTANSWDGKKSINIVDNKLLEEKCEKKGCIYEVNELKERKKLNGTKKNANITYIKSH